MEFLPEEDLDLKPHLASADILKHQTERWAYLMNNVKITPPPDYGPNTPKVIGNCMLITLPTSSYYYYLRVNGKDEAAHRFSWMYHRGLLSIPKVNEKGEEIVIRHLCHQHYCIAPNHLRSGTRESNADDSAKCGITSRGSATLTDDQARAIRESRYPKNHPLYKTQKERALYFNTTVAIVRGIDQGITYTHVRGSNDELLDQSRAKQKQSNLKKRRKKHQNRKWRANDWFRARQYLEKNSQPSPDKCFAGIPCREWTGHVLHKHSGLVYGRAHVNGLSIGAHVLSALISNGCKRPPLGTVVCHKCHNPKCIEPKHIHFDSQKVNMNESAQSGRLAKLTTIENVLKIRYAHYTGKSRRELAKTFNLPITCIRDICLFRSWKSITTPEIDQLYQEYMKQRFPDPNTRPKDPRREKKREPIIEKPLAFDGIFGPPDGPPQKRIKLPPL